ncbi:MAG: SGNH/GDSL hydrolase family protein [Clostridia bacterium]|nr:SGNH/GDSL hydrolase family protein [Clostridia bacterium]
MKRTFSLLLALLMVLSCAVMPVMAETENAADLVNLYDFYQSCGDTVAEDGTVSTGTDLSSNSMIPVTGGAELYFGPCTEGTVNLATYDENGDFIVLIPVSDCVVTDTLSDGSVIYSYILSSNASYIWIAAENAYADSFVLTEDQPLDGELLDAYHAINPLEGKRALFIGDSITHGVKDTPSDHYGWAGRIGTANNMYWVNNGQSGYSVSTCRVGRGDYDTIESKLVETKYESFDYVLLHGGVNDVMDLVSVGEITEGYDPSQFDVSTFAGGLAALFYKA